MAGKSKIVRGASEMLAELPDFARRWIESLHETTGHRVEPLANWPEFVEKVKNIAESAPASFNQYDPRMLRSEIAAAAEGHHDLAVIDPKDFRLLASRDIEHWLPGGKNYSPEEEASQWTLNKISEYTDYYEKGFPKFDALPYFDIGDESENLIHIIGHEGRKRNRALERIGAETSLIKVHPSANARLGLDINFGTPSEKSRLISEVDPEKTLVSEGYTNPSGFMAGQDISVGAKEYKKIKDVLKFMSLGGLAGIYDDDL